MELPPRARRIPEQGLAETRRQGTTSACAENTTRPYHRQNLIRNYLRVRGEYPDAGPAATTTPELPPRARRIQILFLYHLGVFGTTSACAENTRQKRQKRQKRRNYLRVRGEYSEKYDFVMLAVELPPRARRILGPYTGSGKTNGTTSACAENTPAERPRASFGWNYLRVRGEYGLVFPGWYFTMELPPRARRIH